MLLWNLFFGGCLRIFILNAEIFPTLQNYWPRAYVMGNFLEILQELVQETPLIIVSEVHKSLRYPCGGMWFLSFFLFQRCFNFSGIAKSKFSLGKSRVNQGVDWLNLLPSVVSLICLLMVLFLQLSQLVIPASICNTSCPTL